MATIDHFFIFSQRKGTEADLLTQFGLTEGSSNQHPGQGTACRRFFFENCFLELVWVENESEVRSNEVAPTCLWERSAPAHTAFSPFGLCIREEENRPFLFSNKILYAPSYFSQGMSFEIVTHADCPAFPMLFKMPWELGKLRSKEPTAHPVGCKQVTRLMYSLPVTDPVTADIEALKKESWFGMEAAGNFKLTVEFDNNRQHKLKSFAPDLPLEFYY